VVNWTDRARSGWSVRRRWPTPSAPRRRPGRLVGNVHGDRTGNLWPRSAPRPRAGRLVLRRPRRLRGGPGHDLGVVLRDWTGRLDGPRPRQALERTAVCCWPRQRVERHRIWEFPGSRVSTGLSVHGDGAPRAISPYLQYRRPPAGL
jgi:hypothetical protein